MRVRMLEASQKEVGRRCNCESLPSTFARRELDLYIPHSVSRLDLEEIGIQEKLIEKLSGCLRSTPQVSVNDIEIRHRHRERFCRFGARVWSFPRGTRFAS